MDSTENRSLRSETEACDASGREEFSRCLRHEVRNSLNSIQLNTQLLLQGAARDERLLLEQCLDAIRDIDYQLDLMGQLSLALEPRSELAKPDCSIEGLAREIVAMAAELAPGAELSVSGPTDSPRRLVADPDRLRAAFRIVLRHALGADGGAPVDLKVELEPDAVRFVVEGSGPQRGRGRPPQISELYRPAVARAFPLDLVLAHTLLATVGGELTVRNANAQRVACEVYMPAQTAP